VLIWGFKNRIHKKKNCKSIAVDFATKRNFINYGVITKAKNCMSVTIPQALDLLYKNKNSKVYSGKVALAKTINIVLSNIKEKMLFD
jgi:hypothetical protein